MGKTANALVAVRRIAGRCFYCGRGVTPGATTCLSCRPLAKHDPHYNAAARTPTTPVAWNTSA